MRRPRTTNPEGRVHNPTILKPVSSSSLRRSLNTTREILAMSESDLNQAVVFGRHTGWAEIWNWNRTDHCCRDLTEIRTHEYVSVQWLGNFETGQRDFVFVMVQTCLASCCCDTRGVPK